jgi:hypothetical protein
MAQKEEVIVKLKVDTGDSAKDVAEVSGAISDVGESSKNATKSAEGAKGAFSSLGQAIKTLGAATIILKVFEKFAEILGQNSKITKILATATEALSIIVGDFVNFIVDNTQPVIDFFKDAFENPAKFAANLGNAIKANLLERFNSLLEVAGFVGTAFKKLFAGDFAGAAQAAKEAGKELVDVATGVEDTTGKIGELAGKVLDYGKKVLKTAKDNVELANSAEIAAARLQGLIEAADRDAEKQRQIRDDVSKSVSERIEANEKLAKVLEDSQKNQLSQAGLLLQAADANLKKDATNQQFILAKIGAENQLAAIKAQAAGFESEQLVNRTALLLEQQELDKSRIQNANALLISIKKANADLIVDEQDRAIAKRKILDEEGVLELKRLEDNVKLYKEGTQAKVTAENELATKKQEIENNKLVLDNEIRSIYYNRQIEDLQLIQANEQAKFDVRREAIDKEIAADKELFDKKLISEREYNKRVAQLTKNRIDLDTAERKAKESNAALVGQILLGLSSLAQQGTALQKGLALAAVGIDTGIAISGLTASTSAPSADNLATGGISGFAKYATGIVKILANIAQARSIINSVPGGSTGGGSAPSISGLSTSAPVAPTFTPASPTALDSTSLNAINNVVARAYVVESDITGSQKRIRRIENAARI